MQETQDLFLWYVGSDSKAYFLPHRTSTMHSRVPRILAPKNARRSTAICHFLALLRSSWEGYGFASSLGLLPKERLHAH
jgi:hypothetical protein